MKEKTDFPREKPQQLLNAEAKFEGCIPPLFQIFTKHTNTHTYTNNLPKLFLLPCFYDEMAGRATSDVLF